MPLPKNIRDVVLAIENSVDAYGKGLEPIQRRLYRKLLAITKDLSTDAEGNIKTTIANYKTITKVKKTIKTELSSDKYIGEVAKTQKYYAEVQALQSEYFVGMFAEFTTPKVLAELSKQALSTTVETLTESGINETLVKKVTDIVGSNIKAGRNFVDMQGELETFIKGNKKVDGKLVSYSKQIINDSLSQYAGNYTQLVTDDLDLQWFGYVGGLVRDSRPLCTDLIHKKQYIHKSELPGISHGRIDGKTHNEKGKSYKLGMIPGTDASNFIVRRGGYNCMHQLQPISAEFVPDEVRLRFETPTE